MRAHLLTSTAVFFVLATGAATAKSSFLTENIHSPSLNLSVGHTMGGGLKIDGAFAKEEDFSLKSEKALSLSGGISLGKSIRLEVEASGQKNALGDFNSLIKSGEVDAKAVMGKLSYHAKPIGPVTPYVGVSIGQAKLKTSLIHANGLTAVSKELTTPLTGASLGGRLKLNERLDLDIGYRFVSGANLKTQGLKADGSTKSFDINYRHHAVMVGLTYRFGAKKVAPKPVYGPQIAQAEKPSFKQTDVTTKPLSQNSNKPVEAPEAIVTPIEAESSIIAPSSKNYLVHFGFDEKSLNKRSKSTIAEVAQLAIRQNAKAVVIDGHTDLAGSTAYNFTLSKRRAVAVEQSLIAQGVSPSLIVVVPRGESRPLISTVDGKPNEKNRRAEIELRF